jgi:hypothetical protein
LVWSPGDYNYIKWMYDINPSIKYPSSNSHAKSSKTLRLYNAID